MTFEQVDVGVFRGSQPRTGADYDLLKANGVKNVLDLETGARWLGDGNPLGEGMIADQYGTRLFFHPLGVFLPPTHQELEYALVFLLNKKPGVFFHCKEGVDRTGMLAAWYRMRVLKWTKQAAWTEMQAMGSHWYYFYWGLSL